jgi:hypothetical protein
MRRAGAIFLLTLVAISACLLLAEAVILHERLNRVTGWVIEELLGLGEPEEIRSNPEVTSWLRWLLVAAALSLILLARRWGRGWGRGIWIDVSALTIAVLLVYSVAQARADTEKRLGTPTEPVTHPDPGRARFELPAVKLADPLSEFKKNELAVLLIVTSQPSADHETTTKETHRFVVTLGSSLADESNADPVRVTLNRGTDDEQVAALVQALAQMERYYILPR